MGGTVDAAPEKCHQIVGVSHHMPMSRWTAKTIAEIAEFFGVSQTTVKTSWRPRDIVPTGPGPYDLKEITRAYVKREDRNALAGRTGRALSDSPPKGKGEGGLLIAKLQQQVEKLEEEKRKLRRENEAAEEALLDRTEVERYLVQWAIRFRTPLMRLPDKIASRVPGGQKAAVKAEVAADIHAALTMVRDQKLTSKMIRELVLEEAKRLKKKGQPT